MEGLEWVFVLAIVLVILYFVMGRNRRVATMTCNRCNGTGQVEEHWPDPSQPGGWHHVEGTCPKCKGKGRI